MVVCRLPHMVAAVVLLGLNVIHVQAADPQNILFYGNSFTIGNPTSTLGYNYGIPSLVSRIAVAAGHQKPNVQGPTAGGTSLSDHLATNTGIISNPTQFNESPGFQWDYVVLQDYSTRPTLISGVGDRAGFRASSKSLFGLVQEHSADVTPVMYETWARHPSNTSFYRDSYRSLSPAGQSSYPTAANAMQAELRDSYDLARSDLDSLVGEGNTRLARTGDAIQNAFWSNVYASELYHLNNNGYFLSSLILYGTIYQEYVSNINLTGLHNFSATEINRLKALADAVIVVPEPFTGGSLLLAGGAAGLLRRRRQSV